jgi:Protein of unknown function (DUF3298).
MEYDIQIENNTIEREMYYKGTVILRYKISYPQFRSAGFRSALAAVNAACRAKALAFQRTCEQELYPMAVREYEYSVSNGFPVRAFEAQMDYSVTYLRDCALSLYFDRYQFTGGAHGSTVRDSQTWNLRTEHRVTLRQLFPYSLNYREFLIYTINRQIAEQIQQGNNVYFENYEQLTEETFNPESFYLTPDGLAVYYQQYDIAPYSSGIPVFVISYQEGRIVPPSCKGRA